MAKPALAQSSNVWACGGGCAAVLLVALTLFGLFWYHDRFEDGLLRDADVFEGRIAGAWVLEEWAARPGGEARYLDSEWRTLEIRMDRSADPESKGELIVGGEAYAFAVDHENGSTCLRFVDEAPHMPGCERAAPYLSTSLVNRFRRSRDGLWIFPEGPDGESLWLEYERDD